MTLDKYVNLYRLQETADEYGTLQVDRQLIGPAFARVVPKSGSERYQADQVQARALFEFTLYWRDDLAENDVIEWNGTDYNVRFIADRGPEAVYLKIDAERGVAV